MNNHVDTRMIQLFMSRKLPLFADLISIFRPTAGKYGPVKTPDSDTLYLVKMLRKEGKNILSYTLFRIITMLQSGQKALVVLTFFSKSSHRRYSVKKGVLRNFANFTG